MTPAVPSWVTPRAGLGAALSRLEQHGSRLAYLGLSVTAQHDGYRPRLHAALTSRFPQLQAVHAGVGGVGALGCVFLMDDLVTPHRPSLCLIECTTGDLAGQTRLVNLGGALEGIVRKLATNNCAACFVHLYRRDCAFDPADPVLATYERVADHYGVPSIHVGRHVVEAARAGPLDVSALLRDAVHTTPVGSVLTAGLLDDALRTLFALPPAGPAGPPELLYPDDAYDQGRILPVDVSVEPQDSTQTGMFRGQYRYADVAPGSSIVFRHSCSELKGCLVVVGPHAGPILVSNGRRSEVVDTRDAWCVYDRISVVTFSPAFPADVPVSIAPVDERGPTGAGTRFKIIGWLVRPAHSL